MNTVTNYALDEETTLQNLIFLNEDMLTFISFNLSLLNKMEGKKLY